MSTIKDFEVIKTLGSGSYASVFKVKRISDGQEYAMKKVKMSQLKPKEKENALNEVRILASINDENIVAYKEAFFDDDSQSLCIIMEYAGGGDLLKKINDLKKTNSLCPEEDVWRYLIQSLKGLKTLHNMKILHRDLKCANIFLSTEGGNIKLGDLNVSKVAKKGLVYTQTGTPYYASPEVWRDEPYDGKSDIWSLGCVIYELCALKPPFRAQDMDGLYKKIQKGLYERIPLKYSSELASIIASCLSLSPYARPSCEKLLGHPYIVKRLGEATIASFKQPDAHKQNDLLGTIKLPKNMKSLAQNLPKPKYDGHSKVNRSFELESMVHKPPEISRMSLDAADRNSALKRASSSKENKRPGDDERKSPLIGNRKYSYDRREPVRAISLDPDRPGRVVTPASNYTNNRVLPIHPNSGVRRSNDYLNPIQRVADSIVSKSGAGIVKDVYKPPTPTKLTRAMNNENHRPPIITKISSKNSVLSVIDSNRRDNSLERNGQKIVAGDNPKQYIPDYRNYGAVPSSKSNLKPALQTPGHIPISNNGTPQKVVKPVWMY